MNKTKAFAAGVLVLLSLSFAVALASALNPYQEDVMDVNMSEPERVKDVGYPEPDHAIDFEEVLDSIDIGVGGLWQPFYSTRF